MMILFTARGKAQQTEKWIFLELTQLKKSDFLRECVMDNWLDCLESIKEKKEIKTTISYSLFKFFVFQCFYLNLLIFYGRCLSVSHFEFTCCLDLNCTVNSFVFLIVMVWIRVLPWIWFCSSFSLVFILDYYCTLNLPVTMTSTPILIISDT